MTGPLVSVIICVYNAGDYLRPAVQSVLAQTYGNLEVLIVNDGSTDGCMASIADLTDPRIRIIHQANAGKPAAMNAALDQMCGEFYAIQDADDLSDPTRIARQLAAMQANPDVAAVYSGHDLILGDGRTAPVFREKDTDTCRADIARCVMPAHDPTGMYRLDMVRHMRYETDLLVGEGHDYILRVGERWPMMVLGECLYSYRFHLESLTKSDPDRRHRLARKVITRARKRRALPPTTDSFEISETRWSRNRRREFGLAWQFLESACCLVRAGRRLEAIATGLKCAALHPLDPHYHKAIICALSPKWLIRRIRRREVAI